MWPLRSATGEARIWPVQLRLPGEQARRGDAVETFVLPGDDEHVLGA